MSNKEKETDYKKEFVKLFEETCYHNGLDKRSAWDHLMMMFACTISNVTEVRMGIREERETRFEECKKQFKNADAPAQLLSYLMMALTENPDQDFLGDVYMKLSMGEKAWGQCFTPYHICNLMAQLSFGEPEEPIKENGFCSVSDPCVGGGAMLIAAAQIMREKGYDVSSQMIAVGQDIDLTAVNMAFVQLSIIGVPAVIVCGNALTEPYTGHPMFVENSSNYWYTPALFTDTWTRRRIAIAKEIREAQKKSA